MSSVKVKALGRLRAQTETEATDSGLLQKLRIRHVCPSVRIQTLETCSGNVSVQENAEAQTRLVARYAIMKARTPTN
jgi:hypothetical protein